MQKTDNTRAFIEAEQYSDFILKNLEDGLLPDTFYRNVSDFMKGDTLHIKTIGEVTLQEGEEDVPFSYNPIETGEVTFQITEYVGDSWYVTDDMREDGTQTEELMVQRAVAHTRALQERFESDYLKTAAQVFENATDGVVVNDQPHFIVSGETNDIFSLDYLIQLQLSADVANVPAEGRVFIVAPVVGATLNTNVSISNDVTPFAAEILRAGVSTGMRFRGEWFGWDIIVSNRLHRGAADDGTNTIADAVFNIGMCVLDDQTKPIMGAWRRLPSVEGGRNKDHRRDEYTDSARYGFGVQRIDTLFCVATSPTAYK